ncbi:multiple PDZ domain protein [Elysia marginata]|uniref:Multiple PDZ domain protein n=1 Tax=Elysia marginata TaxID=1093978 RepID=A0AAV4JHW2_9GAST|nr:multiple PDZ domain protein [Elysia marginata]
MIVQCVSDRYQGFKCVGASKNLSRLSGAFQPLSITYIPGSAVSKDDQSSPGTTTPATGTSTPHQSPLLQKLAQSLEAEEHPLVDRVSEPAASVPPTTATSPAEVISSEDSRSPLGQKTLLTDGSPAVGNQAWGAPRSVQLVREPGKSLGISIVGGRVDMFNVSQEHSNAGIFIKHVLGDSPAGRNGTLKKGDRILEVNGVDVRNATHDEAVEVIRNSDSPINFVVQSLSYSTCPGDLDSSQLKAVQSFEESANSSPTRHPPSAAVEAPVAATAAAATASLPSPLAATAAGAGGGGGASIVAPPLLGTQASLTSSSPGSTPQQSFEQGPEKVTGESFSDSEDEDEFGYTKKKIGKKYADLPGLVQLVALDRGNAGMGLGLAGNKDRSKMSVFVAGIQPGSPAAWDGRIQVGDELLEVNGINLNGLSHLNASAVIKGVTTPVVKLVTHRRDDFSEHMAVKPLRYGGSSQFDVSAFFFPSCCH